MRDMHATNLRLYVNVGSHTPEDADLKQMAAQRQTGSS